MAPTDAAATSAGGPRAWQVWVGLLTVYMVWGSTYLGIRVAVQTMPPLLHGGVRFVVAGVILASVLALRGGVGRLRVAPRELAGAALIGLLMLLIGNGLVSVGELTVPSGLAALIIGVVPLLVLLLRWLTGERVPWLALGSVLVGFIGLGVLLVPQGIDGTVSVVGVVVLFVSAVAWAMGSFASGRISLPRDPFVSSTYQLLVGGALLLVVGSVVGEWSGFSLAQVSVESWLALAYLIVFGSVTAYTCFTWLLQNAPISKVSTYAYVNPVVAVFLGWLILREQVTPTTILGAAIIVASVAFIVWTSSRGERPAVPDVAWSPEPRAQTTGVLAPEARAQPSGVLAPEARAQPSGLLAPELVDPGDGRRG